MLPAVTKYDGVDMQRFIGFSQSLESMVTIAGPALAAMLISFVGGVESLWFTAAMSLSAAIVTCTIPRKVGKVPHSGHLSAHESAGLVKESLGALRRGLHVLFRSDGILTASVSLSLGIVMILGSFQGLVLPVFFTGLGEPALLGFTLSAMSAGMLAGSLAYAALTHKIKRRTWYVASFVGMGAGVAIIGLFPPYPIMLAGSVLLGFAAGPASALLGFFMLDRVPDASRGSAFGTQNSITMVAAPVAVFATSILVSGLGAANAAFFMLDRVPDASRGSAFGTQNSITMVAAPVAVFATSILVSGLGAANAALALIAGWIALTIVALVIRPMRRLDAGLDSAHHRRACHPPHAQARRRRLAGSGPGYSFSENSLRRAGVNLGPPPRPPGVIEAERARAHSHRASSPSTALTRSATTRCDLMREECPAARRASSQPARRDKARL